MAGTECLQSQSPTWGAIAPGDTWQCLPIFLIVTNRGKGLLAAGTNCVEGRDAAKNFTIHRQLFLCPSTKNYLAPTANSAEVETCSFKGFWGFMIF